MAEYPILKQAREQAYGAGLLEASDAIDWAVSKLATLEREKAELERKLADADAVIVGFSREVAGDFDQLKELVDEHKHLLAALKHKNRECDGLEQQLAEADLVISQMHAAHAEVMAEKCPFGETHCHCVPVLRQQLSEARKDTERLDWLETECNGSLLVASGKLPRRKGDTLRAALDAARKENPE